ncbi:MAG: hypothetical protein ACYDGW_08170 [Vulcanimicrobiaceae bacterium]
MNPATLSADLAMGDATIARLRDRIARARGRAPNAAVTAYDLGMLDRSELEATVRDESTRCEAIQDELGIVSLETGELSEREELALYEQIAEILYQPGDAFGRYAPGHYVVTLPWTSDPERIAPLVAGIANSILPERPLRIGSTTLRQRTEHLPVIPVAPTPNRLPTQRVTRAR